MRQTMFDNWIVDFRKILFCIGVIALGTLFNVEEPKALAIAVIVQGAGNIDGFWDFLSDGQICNLLKILSVILILFSTLAAIFAIFTLGSTKKYFDMGENNQAWIYILLVVFAVAFPIIPLFTDTYLNIKKVSKRKKNAIVNMDGEDEDEL